ncbi:MAG: CPBP family intramembrane metalloprotease [Puniceicoccales bacterium]|jgi:membrane protease YdiL (CAAX protease family)|nr:CPBP family intramembrane metalloprotease [Puniceicoccales bacterium]
MNYAAVYCVACFVLCAIGIVEWFGSRNVECIGVGALNVAKERLLWAFSIFLSITLFVPILLKTLLEHLFGNQSIGAPIIDLISTCVSLLASLVFACRIYGALRIRNCKKNWLTLLGEGACGFGVALPVVLLVSWLWLALLIALNKFGFNVALQEQGPVVLFGKLSGFLPKFLFSLAAVAVAPVAEELIFRGGLYRVFKSHLTRGSSAILTSIIFAALHFSLVALLPLFTLSIFLIKGYDRSGNIFAPIIMHAIFNCNSLVLMALFHPQV